MPRKYHREGVLGTRQHRFRVSIGWRVPVLVAENRRTSRLSPGFRYYDNVVGRFLSEDPIGFNGGNDFYAYVQNNPLIWTDPLGLVHCTYDVTNHHYHCVSDDGTQTYDTTRVRSGNGDCANNTACSATRNRGPIPPGRYNMGGMGDTPNPHRVPRVFLTPQRGTPTLGRDSLEVHQGGANDSAGCITIDPAEYNRFRRFYEIDNDGDTTVQ